MPERSKNNPVRSGLEDVPRSVRPLPEIGKMSVGPGGLGIRPLRHVRKTIIHSTGVVLQPVAIQGDGSIGTARGDEQVLPRLEIADLRDLASDLRKHRDEQIRRPYLHQ